jgi:drug/metabolite transporter (DMT)-like permease
MNKRLRFSPNLAIFISIMAVSTASILIRMSDSPPIAIAAYRMIISTLILSPYFFYTGGLQKVKNSGTKGILSLILVGIVLAIHFASWISSLSLTSVSSSVIFVHIDPIFVALFSHFYLKEKVKPRTIVGILVAITGATLIAVGDAGIGKLNLYGDLLALIGGIMLGIYLLAGRHLRQKLDLTSYVTPVYASSAIVLVIAALLLNTPLISYPLEEYLLFSAIAIIPMIFGHTVYNWALKYVSAPIVSISLLGEPVGASILAFFILKESPSLWTLIGGLLTLIGIFIAVYQREAARAHFSQEQV